LRFQIGRYEPFGEPVADRLEERQSVSGTALANINAGASF
jgi:hypothetical protein